MDPILSTAVKAAHNAGKLILRYAERLERIAVEQKGFNDFVSEVDRMAEDEIIATIHARFAEHAIVAEERGGEVARTDAAPEYEWIIDPIDGTANYLHARADFAVAIAVRHNGALAHGVVYDPLRDEVFSASRGQGAYCNRRRIRVTAQTQLSRALVSMGFPHKRRAGRDEWFAQLRVLLPQVGDLRRSGCSSLDLAYVASGRLDGYLEDNLQPWDIAAGALLVREAGGLVTDFGGAQEFLHSGSVVAANRELFSPLLHIARAETPTTP